MEQSCWAEKKKDVRLIQNTKNNGIKDIKQKLHELFDQTSTLLHYAYTSITCLYIYKHNDVC